MAIGSSLYQYNYRYDVLGNTIGKESKFETYHTSNELLVAIIIDIIF
jgi:hypothetical protein